MRSDLNDWLAVAW